MIIAALINYLARRLDDPENTVTTPTCRTCGNIPPKTPDITWTQWERLRYCDEQCDPRPPRWRRDELLAELQLLLGTDEPASIARRLGIRPRSLVRRLDRYGRHDLARHFLHAA